MRNDPQLNGSDYLMLGFDYELRRCGYPGNSCQIILELGKAVSPDILNQRLADLTRRHPILAARPGGFFLPKWKIPQNPRGQPVCLLGGESAALDTPVHKPLTLRRGELLRFDLVPRDGGKMNMVFTWTHSLMDANSAEHFLAVTGGENVPAPALEPAPPPRVTRPLWQRLKIARKSVLQFDEFCKARPRSAGVRFPNAPAVQRHLVEKLTSAETARAREQGARLGGPLGDAQFHAAVSLVELHRLHERIGCPSASYVLPVPVGLRPKGSVEPLFSNQITMMMTQFLPAQLGATADAVAAFKIQTAQALRQGLIESGVTLANLSRVLPLPVYMGLIKQGLRGEICSLFYGNTAAVTPLLTTFLGAPITDFTHVGAVTPSPGIGVIFYYFRESLRFTVLYLEQHFSNAEAASFAAGIRARLLDP